MKPTFIVTVDLEGESGLNVSVQINPEGAFSNYFDIDKMTDAEVQFATQITDGVPELSYLYFPVWPNMRSQLQALMAMTFGGSGIPKHAFKDSRFDVLHIIKIEKGEMYVSGASVY